MRPTRGEGEIIGLIVLALLGLAIYGGFNFVKQGFGGEQIGTIKYDDCRQIINQKEGDPGTHFKNYICNTQRTTDGRVISGTCVHVDLNNDGTCDTAYVYQKQPQVSCPDSNESVNPDGSCSCNYGYVMSGKTCVSDEDYCQGIYGINSYGISGAATGSSQCFCDSGYIMSDGSCISEAQDCQDNFGPNSYASYTDGLCYCDSGYTWNEDRSWCISDITNDFSY